MSIASGFKERLYQLILWGFSFRILIADGFKESLSQLSLFINNYK
jgi:hypothetical protein